MVFLIGDWRNLAVRGVAAVMFGLLTLLWPGLTLTALVLLFGAFVLLNGVAILTATLRGEPETRGERGWLILEGVVSVVAGLLTFAWPHITALVLLYLIAVWAAGTGALELAIAVRLRQTLQHEWLLAAAGVLSLLFAALLVISPGAGALAITWLIGWYSLVAGALVLALAVRVRKLETSRQRQSRPARQATA
ncbi:MAG TPA: HdeD family acid-resistance protein [Acidimicrobiia bacterium]|nr:HdeD family acid-resistance protein [Acidimicrobiia bacterium]